MKILNLPFLMVLLGVILMIFSMIQDNVYMIMMIERMFYLLILVLIIIQYKTSLKDSITIPMVTNSKTRKLCIISIIYILGIIVSEYLYEQYKWRSLVSFFQWIFLYRPIVIVIITHIVFHHSKTKLSVREILPICYILTYYAGFAAVSYTQNPPVEVVFITYFVIHPSNFNLFILVIAFLFLGYEMIKSNQDFNYKSHRSMNFKLNYYASIALIMMFPILLEFLVFMSQNQITTRIHSIKFSGMLFVAGVYIFINLVNGLSVNSYILIRQPLENLLIINMAGLPVLSYNFTDSAFSLEDQMILSGSLKAIYSFISDADHTSDLKSISLENKTVLFRVSEKLIYLLIIGYETKVIESSFNLFVNYFNNQHHHQPKEGLMSQIDQENLQFKEVIGVLFGLDTSN